MCALALALLAVLGLADGAEPPPEAGQPDDRADARLALAADRSDARAAHGLVLELRSDFGFRRLVEVQYTTGRTIDLRLNDGLTVAVGGTFLPRAGGHFGTRATVGVKLDLVHASNGTAVFTAFPVDLVEDAYVGPVRVGTGVSVLLSPRIAADGLLRPAAIRFDPAPGGVLDAQWLLPPGKRTAVGVRASWYRFSWHGAVRGAASVGLTVRSDVELGGR